MTSPDGIKWTVPGVRVRPMTWDKQKMGYWDEELRKYVVYERVMSKRERAIGRLEINVNSSAMGSVRIELLNENGHVISGFSKEECEKISFNDLSYVVKWRGKSDVSELAGKPVQLKFIMRGAKLYAFQFTS